MTNCAPPSVHSPAPDDTELLALADQCVKCGLCLPHCPTYAQTRNEADSPRGRIALVQGWVSGALQMNAPLAAHLDGCLLCRACERACPSRVDYGHLMDGARARQVRHASIARRWLGAGVLHALSDRRAVAWLGRLARVARTLWPARWLLPTSLAAYRRLAEVFARAPVTQPDSAPPSARCEIDLFVGCMEEQAQGAALTAILTLSRALGVRVHIPDAALCCGALLRHNGHVDAAEHQRARCVQAFDGQRALVGMSSACVGELRGAPELSTTWEVCDFLAAQPWPSGLQLHTLPARVLVHTPCSRRQFGGSARSLEQLLGRIPGVSILHLADDTHCCGAAGTYLLRQPSMSQALLAELLEAIRHHAPDYLVTTNAGCALQLAAGVREAGLAVEVCHPLELLARQLMPDVDAAPSNH